jgi:2-deoxy-D-gluconate 3-dehydrogenase
MILEKFSLEGKKALITGAARGLGQAMAVGLAEAGADVAGVSHSSDDAETKARIENMGRKYFSIKADLKKMSEIERVIKEAVENLGHIDILVNNSGIIRRAPAEDFTEEAWDDVMDVNAKAVFFLSQAAARHMIKRGKGKIINIASLLSFQGGILVASYAASKGAVATLTKAMANEWAKKGINVNAIAPGYMKTQMTLPLQKDENRNEAILERIPMGRWGEPEDLKGAAVFLASEASDYVNGHILCVDGGWLGR